MTYKEDKLLQQYEDYCLDAGLTKLRINKLKVMYRMVKRHLKKDLNTLKTQDISEYATSLNKGNVYFRIDGKELSSTTVSDIKKFLKQFFKWLLGEGTYYPDEVKRIIVKIPKDKKPKAKETIDINQVMQLANTFQNIDYKITILILFDSGFRIGEFTSVKKENIKWQKFDDDNSCFFIYCPDSKTFQREIPLPLFTEDLKQYFNSASFQAKANDDPIFNISYESLLRKLKIKSKELFNKNLTFHSLRHSSATYWSNELEYLQLCTRFGWSFDSKQAKIYVRRSKKQNVKAATVTFTNELLDVKKENNDLKERIEHLELINKENNETLQGFISEFQKMKKEYWKPKLIPVK